MSNYYAQHQDLLSRFSTRLCKEIPEATIHERHVGKFLYLRILEYIGQLLKSKDFNGIWRIIKNPFKFANSFIVSINSPGMCDAYILYNNGENLVHIEVECKTGNSRLKKDQKRWKDHIKRSNGIYIELRDIDKAIEDIKKGLGIL